MPSDGLARGSSFGSGPLIPLGRHGQDPVGEPVAVPVAVQVDEAIGMPLDATEEEQRLLEPDLQVALTKRSGPAGPPSRIDGSRPSAAAW
jgi:hypothetical protein